MAYDGTDAPGAPCATFKDMCATALHHAQQPALTSSMTTMHADDADTGGVMDAAEASGARCIRNMPSQTLCNPRCKIFSGIRSCGAHLQVALRLHEAAHHAEHRIQLLGVAAHGRGGCGDDGVVRPLAGRQAVGVVFIQDEVGAPVLHVYGWLVTSQPTKLLGLASPCSGCQHVSRSMQPVQGQNAAGLAPL